MASQHRHDFAAGEWPFPAPSNTIAFSNNRVLREKQPILLVSHDHDGDWQFLCGSEDPGECLLICLGCAYELDRSLGAVADLPVGWIAWRQSASDPWLREPREASTDE